MELGSEYAMKSPLDPPRLHAHPRYSHPRNLRLPLSALSLACPRAPSFPSRTPFEKLRNFLLSSADKVTIL